MLLVDEFLRKMETTGKKALKKVNDPYVASGMDAVWQAGELCDKIIFGESTMRMLVDKMRHFEETVQEVLDAVGEVNMQQLSERITAYRGAWVQFHKPIDNVEAFLVFVPSFYLRTGKDQQQMYLVTPDAEIADVLECATPGGVWRYIAPLHKCPGCIREFGGAFLIPCEACRIRLVAWGEIIALSAIIAGQYLAERRYVEKVFTAMRREKRLKSNKDRRVPVKHIFKVIDANELIIQVPALERPKEHCGSWLDGTEIYEEIRTRPFMRTYRHPRYVHVRGTTIAFPEGIKRLQPRKPELLGKQITKVKASHYEGEHNGS